MNPLALLGASTKAGLSRKLPFAPNLSSGGYQTHSLPGLSAISPTDPQHFPDPLTNTVVAACVNAIAQALPDAPPVLEQRQNDGTWKRLPSHPILDLLNFPNPYHSTSDIWALTVAQEATRGEAFWILSFDNTTPREIWVWPTEKVTVEGTAAQPISGYTVYGETGAPVRLQNHEVIHFRHRPAIANWRRGEAPLLTGTRQIAADNAAASYHSAILRNAGVLSLLISLKDSASAGEVTPGQLQEYLDKLKRKLTGDGAGAIAGLDLPLDVHKIGYSPDEMALDKLVNYYESRICALMGVDPMVCGLGSGTLQKTYANLSEALNDFWERQIIPLLRRHAATLTAQLFPSFGLSPTDYRLTFDTTAVPALQENLDALFTRWRELYSSGGCDLYTLQSQIGLPDVPQEYKGQFAKLPQKQEEDDPNGTKMIDANGMSHDELGLFDGGNGDFSGGRQRFQLPPRYEHFPSEEIFEGSGSFWGGRNRDETTKKHFNGKYGDINIRQPEKVEALSQDYFGFPLKPHEWGQLVGAPDGSSIDVKVDRKTSLEIKLKNPDLITGLALRAVHQNDGSTPARCFLENVELYKGSAAPKDLAPRMLSYQFHMARSLGIDRVTAVAAGSGQGLADGTDKRTGFSRWPQLGFNAFLSKDETDVLPEHLKGCKTLNDLMLREGGFEYWKNNGTGRTVEFNLSPGSNSWRLFNLYLEKKNIKIK